MANEIIRNITTNNIGRDVDLINPFLPEGYLSFIDKEAMFKQLLESDEYSHPRFNKNEISIESHMRKHLERQYITKSKRENHYTERNAKE